MRYCDIWKRKIQKNKLQAYKDLNDQGKIQNVHVIYNRQTGETMIEYDSERTVKEWLNQNSYAT